MLTTCANRDAFVFDDVANAKAVGRYRSETEMSQCRIATVGGAENCAVDSLPTRVCEQRRHVRVHVEANDFESSSTSSNSGVKRLAFNVGLSFFLFGLINNGEHFLSTLVLILMLDADHRQFSTLSFSPPPSTSSRPRRPKVSSRSVTSHLPLSPRPDGLTCRKARYVTSRGWYGVV